MADLIKISQNQKSHIIVLKLQTWPNCDKTKALKFLGRYGTQGSC